MPIGTSPTLVIRRPFYATDYAVRRASLAAGELVARKFLARDVIQAYVDRRELFPAGIRVQNYAKMAEQTGGAGPTSNIALVQMWLVDVERCLETIGVVDARLLLARLRKRPIRWCEIEAALQCGRREAESRFEMAVIHFTDELQRRGLTEKVERAASQVARAA